MGEGIARPTRPHQREGSASMNNPIFTSEPKPVKPCRACGAQDRNSQGKCSPCMEKYRQKWRNANPEKDRESKRKHYAANIDKLRESTKQWCKNNPERRKEICRKYRQQNAEAQRQYRRKWRKANPNLEKAIIHNRRARMKGNEGKLSKDIVQKLLKRQNHKCACCGADLSKTGHHLDHIMPLALGGFNIDANVQLLTPLCNLKKGAKHPAEWMREIAGQ